MELEQINTLAAGDESLLKTLVFGYLRGLSAAAIATLLDQYALEAPLGDYLFRAFVDCADAADADQVANLFLGRFRNLKNYRVIRRYGYYLNKLLPICSVAIQRKIAEAFLKSGKRFLRKYAYSTRLDLLGEDLIGLAWSEANSNDEEASFLIHAMSYNYPDNFIDEWFHKLVAHPHAEEYQLRKLYSRKSALLAEDWEWLEHNLPVTFVYLSSRQNQIVSDETCYQIYEKTLANKPAQFWMDPNDYSAKEVQPDRDGLLLWCFARMRKWDLLRKILAEADGKSVVGAR